MFTARRYSIQIVFNHKLGEEMKSWYRIFASTHDKRDDATREAEREFREDHPDAHIWGVCSEVVGR